MKAIETKYNGYRFRSRLEARWAVFLDALGVKYEYEPEGFQKDGLYYLPDFRVKCGALRGESVTPFDLYIEVKGNMTDEDRKKIGTFAVNYRLDEHYNSHYVDGLPIYVVGDIPCIMSEHDTYDSSIFNSYDDIFFNYCCVDGDYFAAYPTVIDGMFGLMGDDGHYIEYDDPFILVAAYRIAREVRFEHGETPTADEVRREAESLRDSYWTEYKKKNA